MKQITLNAQSLRCRDLLFLGGAYCRLATNSPALAYALGSRWRAAGNDPPAAMAFDAVLHVGAVPRDLPLGMHFRGAEQFVFASFPEASFCLDLERRKLLGVVSPAVAADDYFWNCMLLPIALGVLGPSLDINPTHCAAISVNAAGVLIAGVSGAGKSTLAYALGRRGVPVVSDDWTYVAWERGSLVAHGLEVPFKLMPESAAYFQELAALEPSVAINGELAFEVAAGVAGVRMARSCRPQLLVMLERQEQRGCSFQPLPPETVRRFFAGSAERLPARMAGAAAVRATLIERIAGLQCWRMCYGGTPQYGAEALHEFCLEALCPRS